MEVTESFRDCWVLQRDLGVVSGVGEGYSLFGHWRRTTGWGATWIGAQVFTGHGWFLYNLILRGFQIEVCAFRCVDVMCFKCLDIVC